MDNNSDVGKEQRDDQHGTKRPISEVEECTTDDPSGRKKDLKLDSQAKCSNEIHEAQRASKDSESKIDYKRKRKCVLLLSYNGKGYNGMQRNPGVRTIEEDLTNALLKARAISEDGSRNFGKMSFQRCARTDKGVSASRQVVSLKMVPYKELVPEINKHLEPQIRVFALKQVTRGFDCKSRCSSRTYKYLLPTFAFSPTYAHTTKDFRITDEILQELNLVLREYEGTKNFHNFTSGKNFKEESAKRYIIQCNVDGEPIMEGNMQFLVLKVQGQSFMQHQIRKMIGLVIAIMQKFSELDAIPRAFQQPKMDIPRAPGLGLILDQVHFKSYNERFGSDGEHEPLEWSECEDKIEEFRRKYIFSDIINTERTTNSMMKWLNTLHFHAFNREGMTDIKKMESDSAAETATNRAVAETTTNQAVAETTTNQAVAETTTNQAVAETTTNQAVAETTTNQAVAETTTNQALENS